MEVFQSHVGLWIAAHKLLHRAAHVMQSNGIDSGHAHAASHLLVQCPYLVLQRLITGNNFSTPVEKNLPLARGCQGSLGSFDELDSEPSLELADHLAGPRLRNAVLIGRTGKAAASDNIAKNLKGFQIHRIPPLGGSFGGEQSKKATKRFKDTSIKMIKTDTDFTHYSVNQYILARLASSSTGP